MQVVEKGLLNNRRLDPVNRLQPYINCEDYVALKVK